MTNVPAEQTVAVVTRIITSEIRATVPKQALPEIVGEEVDLIRISAGNTVSMVFPIPMS